MIPHWTEQRKALRKWLVTHPRILIGCDFDGTLAPVVPHAGEARLPTPTKAALRQLAARPGVVLAFISGRALDDLYQRIDLAGALYAGNHGLEMRALDGSTIVAPGAAAARPALRDVLSELDTTVAQIPGVWIEDKHLTASIHYRLADDSRHAEIERLVRSAMRHAPILQVRPGKRIWEIRPAIEWNKGTALRWFMDASGIPAEATSYMGDDATDFDAFHQLHGGWTFFVGSESCADATVRIHDPSDTAALLKWMGRTRKGAAGASSHACHAAVSLDLSRTIAT